MFWPQLDIISSNTCCNDALGNGWSRRGNAINSRWTSLASTAVDFVAHGPQARLGCRMVQSTALRTRKWPPFAHTWPTSRPPRPYGSFYQAGGSGRHRTLGHWGRLLADAFANRWGDLWGFGRICIAVGD
jgi:hypothetical protein